jgi:GH24 family phage-related lysozyme (muramidase)
VVKPEGGLPGFRGDLHWLHERESHAGRPYWPGGISGVTLDPGLDLGHASVQLVERLVRPLVSPEQWSAIWHVLGMKGQRARQALKSSPVLQALRTSREQAAQLLPAVALPYWQAILRRFPPLAAAPPAVQTALLSLAYNRGAGNAGLAILGSPLEAQEWKLVGNLIGLMQQDHPQLGIRSRRRLEGDLILESLLESEKAGCTPATP